MAAKASFRRIVIGLMLLSIILGVSIAYATLENGYKNDTSFLTDTSESTSTENGYKISIVLNPNTLGIYSEENGYKLDLAICPEGVGGALEENGYRLDIEPENLFPDVPDTAVTGIVPSQTAMPQISPATINVTVANKALDYETFQVIVNANDTAILTQTVTLTGATSTTITFSWDAAGFTVGNYTISAHASAAPGEADTADNTLVGGIVEVRGGGAEDVAVTNVSRLKTVVGQGYGLNLTVTAANLGPDTETFTVTGWINSSIAPSGLGFQPGLTVSNLPSGNTTNLLMSLNTNNIPYGNYTIGANASSVPGETNTANNNFTDGIVTVTIPGDINGSFNVTLTDLVLLANAYSTTPASGGTPGTPHAWNPNADINNDGKVSLQDLVILAKYYGKHYP